MSEIKNYNLLIKHAYESGDLALAEQLIKEKVDIDNNRQREQSAKSNVKQQPKDAGHNGEFDSLLRRVLDAPKVEGYCEKHGAYKYREPSAFNGITISAEQVQQCPTCYYYDSLKRIRAQEAAQIVADNEANRAKRLMGRSEIPVRFMDASLDDYPEGNQQLRKFYASSKKYVESFDKRIERDLIIVGDIGTGKTHMACAIAIALQQRGFTVLYTTISELVTQYRSTWGGEGDEAKFMSSISKIDFLIIDEIGVQNKTDNERVLFTEFVDRRSRDGKSTVIISNISVTNLESVIGERAMNRLSGFGAIVKFKGESLRNKTEIWA